MRIATWNVNSVRARLERLLPWLSEQRPEVVCLQETKCLDEAFPREPIEELGYQVETYGQKTYNGVAILSRSGLEDVHRGLPGDGEDAERRVISAQVGDLRVVNVYVVNGHSVGSDKYEKKLRWLEELREYLAGFDMAEKVLVTGDFNITFDDRDVHDPEAWRERILCSTPERDALAGLIALGFVDALREFDSSEEVYTWWDFRTRAFRRNRGLRIDHFLLSPPAQAACRGVVVDREAREGAKPSDHAPVIATLEDA